MRKAVSTLTLIAALAMMLTTGGGCFFLAGAAAGAVGIVYTKGDLTGYEDATVPRTAEATKLAMKDLGFPLLESYATSDEGEVNARVGSDNKATVHLDRKSDQVCKINIRIGTFGDEALSRQILEKIQLHLKEPVAGAAAVP